MLLKNLLQRYMMAAGDDGAAGGRGTVPDDPGKVSADAIPEDIQAAMTENNIKSADEWNALAPMDRAGLMVQTDDSDLAEPAPGSQFVEVGATPPPPPPPPAPGPAAPAPSTAPAASPAPSAAPVAATPPAAPAQAPAAPAPVAAAPVADETSADPLGLPPVQLAPRPILVTQKEVDRLPAVKTELNKALEDFNEGRIDQAAYEAKIAPLEQERDTINGNVAAQRAVDSIRDQTITDAFNQSVATLFAAAKTTSGIDYGAPENAALTEQLDTALKRFAQAAPIMYPNMNPVWRDRWALNMAHKEVCTANGKPYAGVNVTAPPPPAPAPSGPPGRRAPPDLSLLPPTTRGAPPAADPGIQAGEFAHLDAITNPMDLERAVAAMSKEQQARYLAD